jgi:hypothetical protein
VSEWPEVYGATAIALGKAPAGACYLEFCPTTQSRTGAPVDTCTTAAFFATAASTRQKMNDFNGYNCMNIIKHSLAVLGLIAAPAFAASQVSISIDASQPGPVINKNV